MDTLIAMDMSKMELNLTTLLETITVMVLLLKHISKQYTVALSLSMATHVIRCLLVMQSEVNRCNNPARSSKFYTDI